MSQMPERSRYRKFVFASADRRAELSGDYINVVSLRLGRAYRLSPAEFELARLFDGTRDAAAVRVAAGQLGQPIGDAELQHFATELAQADLLIPGTEEPLPVIPQTDAEAALIGTPGAGRAGVAAPSTVPGSLSGPGTTGSIGGSSGTYRGQPSKLSLRLPLWPGLLLGYLLALPAMSVIVLVVVLIGIAALIKGVMTEQAAISGDFAQLLHPLPAVLVGLFSIWLTNFCMQIARAAALQTVAKSKPEFGLTFWLGFFPWFHTPTSGAIEQAPRRARMRVVGSSLTALLVLIILALVGYFVSFHSGTFIAPICLGVASVATIFLIVNINPLTRRDGYFLLTQWLEIPDLREQAMAMIFGLSRPWQQAPTLSPTVLTWYAILSAAFIVFVCTVLILGPGTWLEVGWGATGVIIFLALIALLIYDTVRRVSSRRGSIGNIKLAAPATWVWIVAFALAAASLIPYTFEPSGSFTVLPHDRADIRALIAGDIRKVMVHEGDMVQANQVLAQLSDDEEQAQVAQSKADLDRLNAQLALRKAGGKPEEVAAAQQAVETAQTRYNYSRSEADRIDAAFKRKAVSQQDRDRAVGTADVDKQQLLEAERRLALVKSPSQADSIKEVEAQIAAEQAQLEYHQQQLAYTQIRAPIAGRIVSRDIQLMFPIGHYMNRGDLFATVEDTGKLYAEIQMPEVSIGEVKVGAAATIKASAYPGTEFTGTVAQIAPDAQRQTPGPRIVRVLVVVDDPDHLLRPEMTGEAKVTGRVYPAAAAFLRPVVRFFMVEFWSWLP